MLFKVFFKEAAGSKFYGALSGLPEMEMVFNGLADVDDLAGFYAFFVKVFTSDSPAGSSSSSAEGASKASLKYSSTS